MTAWVRLDVDYFTNPRVLTAGNAGRDLHLAAICWAGAHETDGVIPAQAVPLITSTANVPRTALQSALGAGLLVVVDGSTLAVRDYLDRNPSREQVTAQRERWRKAQRRHRERDALGRFLPESDDLWELDG